VRLVDDEDLAGGTPVRGSLRDVARGVDERLDVARPAVRRRVELEDIVVLPTPRGPQKRYACASRSWVMALRRVCATCAWPTTSSNDWGRYLRAKTT